MSRTKLCRVTLSALAATLMFSTAAVADPYGRGGYDRSIFQQVMPDPEPLASSPYATDEGLAEAPSRFRRQIVAYDTREAPGTIIVDTPNTHLYLVLGNGRAIRYGIGVGRDGFTWAGTQTVARKQEWPDWHPPAEMIARQPYLPRFMSGGPGNPLGARALYLGNTMYRIHGTNAPETIGQRVSSGCIRLTNDDIVDLFNRVPVGAKVVVLPDSRYRAAAAPQSRESHPVRERVAAQPTLSYGSSASRLY